MHIHLYTRACGCTYALVHSCRRILFICTVQSLYYMCVYDKCFPTPACVCGRGLEMGGFPSLFMISACYWGGRLCFGRGRDKGFVFYFSLFLRVFGWWVGGCLYVHVHTQTTWVLDVSPGVGRPPWEPEESRLNKVQYTCRPYRCTKTFVYIYAGLRVWMIWVNCLFSF